MMLVKRSPKNQIAIPKAILERAGLGEGDVYFEIRYSTGQIILTPMQLEEKVPVENLKQFENQMLKQEPGDQVHHSMSEVLSTLHRKHQRLK
jgi:bifunctional DNA-binding transcriptional regulator/antitoxin component of YhaV-PrlF toxin-antitoxin module